MNQLSINPHSPEEQREIMEQMYQLCEKQVKSYHKHRHMGNNSSVPIELAQDLIESIVYTVDLAGGVHTNINIEEALRLGQKILENRLIQAKSMLELVMGTAPQWQTECRWEALRCLRHYLDNYDHLHMAHKYPENLYYPILVTPPEGIKGIDSCLFYLNILWIENRIMAGIPDDTLNRFWDHLPNGSSNQCEHLLINGMGKALINAGLTPLVFQPDEYQQLLSVLLSATTETLQSAGNRLCQWLELNDESAQKYVLSLIPLLKNWIGNNAKRVDLYSIFL